MSWRAGARLFKEIWPLIQANVPHADFRAQFIRELLLFFMECDMDGIDLRGLSPEIDKALDELGVGKG